jgi:hypothetical protein
LEIQYYATLPFEGHHREYTGAEVVWMVQQLRHRVLLTDLYNYSAYGHGVLTGRDVTNHWRMVADPTMRELILVASQKLHDHEAPTLVTDWTSTISDEEPYWQRLAPSNTGAEDPDAIVATERLLVELQRAVAERDGMLAGLQQERVREVAVRDAEISKLNGRIGELQRTVDSTLGARAQRLWRRTMRHGG